MRVSPEQTPAKEDFVASAIRAMQHLPPGKIGLVLGSGQNTQEWKNRGWVTLDIAGKHKADFTADARYTLDLLRRSNQYPLDYLIAEGITIGERAKWFEPEKLMQQTVLPASTGITVEELTDVAHQCLKAGGIFVYMGGNWVRKELATQIGSLGFATRIQAADWVRVGVDHRPVIAPILFAKKP